MSTSVDFSTPLQALRGMIEAGAVFTVQPRSDGLGMNFTYKIFPGGDLDRCRQILAEVKAKPAPFFEAFRAAVQTERGAA